MAMSADEIKKEFGITPEQLDQWEADAAPVALLCSMRK